MGDLISIKIGQKNSNRKAKKTTRFCKVTVQFVRWSLRDSQPIPHIGHCTQHEPRSSISKRNVTESVEKLHLTFVDGDDDSLLQEIVVNSIARP